MRLREGARRGAVITATVRYLDSSGRPVERAGRLTLDDCAGSPETASPRLRQDLVIAMLTDRLVDGPWTERVSVADLRGRALMLSRDLGGDPDVTELVRLIDRVAA